MILSIDVGIRNLAMCLLNETNNLVEEWDVSGVPPNTKTVSMFPWESISMRGRGFLQPKQSS